MLLSPQTRQREPVNLKTKTFKDKFMKEKGKRGKLVIEVK